MTQSPPLAPESTRQAPPDDLVILVVDDRRANLVALERTLAAVPARVVTATSGEEALAASLRHRFALAILDVQMPGMDGYELAEFLRSDPQTSRTPIIFLTAAFVDERHLFQGYKSGAVDYIVKPYDPEILLSKVRVFIELARHRLTLEALVAERTRELRSSEARYHGLFETMAQGVIYQDAMGSIIEANPAALQILGLTMEQLLGRHSSDPGWAAVREDGSPFPGADQPAMQALVLGRTVENVVMGLEHRGAGRRTWIEICASPQFRQGEARPYQVYTTFWDITARKEAEEALEASEAALRAIFQSTQDGILAFDASSLAVQLANDSMARLLLCQQHHCVGVSVTELIEPARLARMLEVYRDAADHGPGLLEVPLRRRDGVELLTEASITRVELRGRPCLLCFFRDTTARRDAERERERLRAELEQAQKMDSIGALAGGVAHDFNNLLVIILGYVGFALESLAADDPVYGDLLEVRAAGERSATLTRQLLAFGRRQVMHRVPLDLNQVTTGVEKLLRRIIGEDIALLLQLEQELGTIQADPGQLEQVVMNLAANARDAMPDGGHLTLRTENVEVDAAQSRREDAIPSGSYVRLSVTDTGCGMSAGVLERIFEPFFTTKPRGRGTGLGMSVVYGIVKQSEGHVHVQSEVGSGTTFRLYFPRLEPDSTCAQPLRAPDSEVMRGDETILVVEDAEAVRKLAERTLTQAGYQVLVACDGNEALAVLESTSADVALVLSDVVMPGMGGEELTDRLALTRPSVKVLFMSGYTDDAFRSGRRLDPALNFLEKPFDTRELLRKVRRLLDTAGAPSDVVAAAGPVASSPPALEPLPAKEAALVAQAARAARYEQLLDLLAQLQPRFPETAAHLLRFVDQYDYEGVLASLTPTTAAEEREQDRA